MANNVLEPPKSAEDSVIGDSYWRLAKLPSPTGMSASIREKPRLLVVYTCASVMVVVVVMMMTTMMMRRVDSAVAPVSKQRVEPSEHTQARGDDLRKLASIATLIGSSTYLKL